MSGPAFVAVDAFLAAARSQRAASLTDALGRDAAEVELDVLTPDLTLLANPSGDGTVGVRHEQVPYTWPVGQTPSRGRYQLMLRATDQHATADGDTPWNNAWHPYAYRDRERHRLPALTASTYWTESSAYFKLYKDAACTQEWPVGAPIGGHAYVGLFVDVDAHDGLNNPYQWDRLVIRDEYADYDPAQFGPNGPELNYADALADSYVDGRARTTQALLMQRYFDVASQWEECIDGAWEASDGPGVAQRGPERRLFRHVLDWDTMHKPLGNNGPHTLSLAQPLQFGSAADYPYLSGMNPVRGVAPAAVGVTTNNLHIPAASVWCSNGTIDYFKWDPSGERSVASPVIAFAIEDADPRAYMVTIRLHHTGWATPSGDADGELHQAVASRGRSRTPVVLDLADPSLGSLFDANAATCLPAGVYTYDLRVRKYATPPNVAPCGDVTAGVDEYWLKRPCALTMPRRTPDGLHDAHEVIGFWQPGGIGHQLRVKQFLHHETGAVADDLVATTFDNRLRMRDRYGFSAAESASNVYQAGPDVDADGQPDGILVHTASPTTEFQGWCVVWTGADRTAVRHRSCRTHTPTRMLAVDPQPVVDQRRKALRVVGTACDSTVTAVCADSVERTLTPVTAAAWFIGQYYNLGFAPGTVINDAAARAVQTQEAGRRRVIKARNEPAGRGSPELPADSTTAHEVIAKWAGYPISRDGRVDLNGSPGEASRAAIAQFYCHADRQCLCIVGTGRRVNGHWLFDRGAHEIAVEDQQDNDWCDVLLKKHGYLAGEELAVLCGCETALAAEPNPKRGGRGCLVDYIVRKCGAHCAIGFTEVTGIKYYPLWAYSFYASVAGGDDAETAEEKVRYWWKTQGPVSAAGDYADGHYGLTSSRCVGNSKVKP